MQKTTQSGEKGELLAQEFLKKKNYLILYTNWRHRHSEIDIIAQHEGTVIFVEVKYRNNNHFGFPEEFVGPQKIRKMQEAAEAYIEQFEWEGQLRFDIISIEKNNVITHFEDAFY
jgi:putative endonuclease